MNTHAALADGGKLYESFETEQVMTWCGGCGNYGIQNAIKRALTLEGLSRNDYIHCFDVGCSGNGSDKIHSNTIHGLHGRVLPLAAGVKLANHKLKVIAEAGDGATFSEGAGHIVHAVRSDYPIVFIHHNNQNYALTTGQPSSLSRCGTVLSAAPDGVFTPPMNHMQLVLSLTPSFVARTFSGDPDHMTDILRQALNHDGFAFIDVLQTCPTYNRGCSNAWYLDRIKPVTDIPNYDNTDIWQARKAIDVHEDDALYTGVLYHKPRLDYYAQMPMRHGVDTVLVDEVQHYDIAHYLDELT